VLPRVLGAEDCAHLIQAFHRSVGVWANEGGTNAGFKQESGDFQVRHHGQYGKLREFVVRDPEVQRLLDSRLQRRVLPEMKKSFQTVPTGREGYRISCYDSDEGGSLRPHRDDSVPQVAHRRFTLTVNLNAGEYEGGELRFPEYGSQLYDVERGTAVVWSATLLHEVLPVRRGRRFITGVHLFGPQPPAGQAPPR
jgi:predicted 2-oxoglutarate/Fe(II)-dependent dioxygenase YbiX